MRLTVEDFGPVMLGRSLDLNDTQTGVLAAVFNYAEDTQLPLVDFADLKKLLGSLTDGQGVDEIKDSYGRIRRSTSGPILRNLVALEQHEVSAIFGEKEFEHKD